MSAHYPIKRSGGAPVGMLAVALTVGLMIAGLIPGLGGLIWPLWFTVPGLALLALMRRLGKGSAFLVIPAMFFFGLTLSILPVALLGAQAFFYAWALLFPLSLGLGLGALGQMKRNDSLERAGDLLSKVGAGLFIGLGAIVESLHLITNPAFALRGLAILAVVGVVALLASARGRRSRRRAHPHVLPRRPRALPQQEVDELEAELFGSRDKVRR